MDEPFLLEAGAAAAAPPPPPGEAGAISISSSEIGAISCTNVNGMREGPASFETHRGAKPKSRKGGNSQGGR